MRERSARDIITSLWRDAGGPADALNSLSLSGAEPALPSSFRVGAVAQATIAASALAAAQVHHDRGGPIQNVSVDIDHACAECRSEQFWRIDGTPTPELWDRIAGTYRCGDGRWVRVHTNFAHHRDGVLLLLGCAYDKAAVQSALSGWNAEDFETQATTQGLVVAMMRSFDEWDVHPQAAAVRALPLWDAVQLDDAPALPWPSGGGAGRTNPVRPERNEAVRPERKETVRPELVEGQRAEQGFDKLSPNGRPLQGLRVLDLTRIIAGPVATRSLASHGADVMTVTAAHLPSIDAVVDTGRGKRACFVDLREASGREALASLVASCDVFVQGYRPGALEALGFGVHDLARRRPGIVVVSLSAYGHEGPWAGKRGFDSLVQTATGFNHAEAQAAGIDAPKPLPCQVLDHGTGFLMAFAAMMTLRRQRSVGGSWHVRLSLARTAQWLRGLGRIEGGLNAPAPSSELPTAWLETLPSAWGALTAVRPAARMSLTAPRYERPSVRLGSDLPQW
jgi:crotonobetainyl-CoA:carnitine CoA-transferase CaiB-like acyl-CoA transferase